jgi:uncharacterized protein YoxC
LAAIFAALVSLVVAVVAAAWALCSFLAKIQSTQKEMKSTQQEMKSTQQEMKSTLTTVQSTLTTVQSTQQEMQSTQQEMQSTLESVAAASAGMTGAALAFKSTAEGLHQAVAGGPITAVVAESANEVSTWLVRMNFGHYAPVLAHLDGAALLLQTEASLAAAGVPQYHVALLLARIRERVSSA